MLNTPTTSGHFGQKRSIVLFVFGESTASISNDMKLTVIISLTQYTAEPTLVAHAARGSINNEGIRAIFAGIIDHRFRTESRAKFVKSTKSRGGEGAPFPV